MSSYEIDKAFVPAMGDNRILDMCWSAFEILAVNMDEGGHDLYEEADDLPPPEQLPDELGNQHDDLTLHETPVVPINAKQHAFLTNTPSVFNPQGRLVLLTEPSTVGLVIEPVESGAEHLLKGPAGGCSQFIFRLPTPNGRQEAIHDGFDLSDETKMDPNGTHKLDKLEHLLVCMRRVLRADMELDPDTYRTTYHSRAPRPANIDVAGYVLDAEITDYLLANPEADR